LLRGWFLGLSIQASEEAGYTYQYGRLVWSYDFAFAVAPDKSLPDLLEWRRGVFLDHGEQRAVPPRHAVGFLIPEDQVFKVILVVPSVFVLVCQKLVVDVATFLGCQSYVHLLNFQQTH
jgi:hypothetical protein